HGAVKPYQRYCISISPTPSIPASHFLNRFYLRRFDCLLIVSSIKTAISSPQRIDKRGHMISFSPAAARALPLDRRADHPKSLRNERFIRRVHVKFANPHLCIQNDERRHPGSPGRLPA
ncbi:hypothetical protein KDX22_20615, partial [Burkholderia cenocepacia]|uniref:hypothetical protein n=2 Tax=Burkholderia cenocepacia TaxID=95486 RepID=UPI001B922A1C